MAQDRKNVRSINCTQCSAPLELYGGHNVKSINCGYCGAVLDSKFEYKVVKQFKDLHRPYCPIKIGSKGKLKDVEFTVIGQVEYQDNEGYTWVENQLFSPTHGYAWLEYDNGHFVFSRKVRDLPDKHVSRQSKSTFMARGQKFTVYDAYPAKITYVEGELTWIAEIGDKVELIDGIAPPLIFTVERTDKEEEYSLGEYIHPLEIYKSFRISGKPKTRMDVHPAQPYEPNPFYQGMSKAAMYYLPVAIILLIYVFIAGSGKLILNESITPDQFVAGKATKTFRISEPDRLVEMRLGTGVRNSWAFFDVIIMRDGMELYSLAKEISYYYGGSGEDAWSEGSPRVKSYFKLPEAGEYNLFVTGESPQKTNLNITIKEGVIVSRYYIGLLILLLIASASHFLARSSFRMKKWAEDDDD
ncbi:MAG: DUF4178 domain-containing protein [Gammaproteobacteria bacterium]|nr:DUF4178 domain-containing protein [Gammaproteobacteria bacterium]